MICKLNGGNWLENKIEIQQIGNFVKIEMEEKPYKDSAATAIYSNDMLNCPGAFVILLYWIFNSVFRFL